MTDLVKRLRDWEHIHPEDHDKPEGYLYEEAANSIESLKGEVVRMRELLGEALYLIDAGRDQIETLEAESALDAERLRITIERAEMAEDERDALREAVAQWVAAREAAMSDVSPATFTELSKAESALARTNKEKSDE